MAADGVAEVDTSCAGTALCFYTAAANMSCLCLDGSDFDLDGSDPDVVNIGGVQDVSCLSTDLFLTYQENDYCNGMGDCQDITIIGVGALLAF